MAGLCDIPAVGEACDVPADVLGGAVGAATDGVVSQMAHTFAGAATQLLETSTSFWLRVDTPTVDSPGGLAAFLQDRTAYLTAAAAVAGVLIGGARMALARRQDPGVQVLRGLVLIALLSSGGSFLVSQLAQASDAWAVWLFDQAVGDDDVNALIGLASITEPGLLLVISLFALLTGILQVALMVSRAALIPVLVGVLPTTAALSMSGKGGGQGVQRVVAWMAALLLYKPVAAVLYAGAFRLSDGSDEAAGPLTAISGLALLVLAILALPALMRVVAPATAVLGGAGTGSMASGVGGTVATGAVILMTGGTGAAAAGSAGAGSAGASGAAGGTGAGGAVAAPGAGAAAGGAPAGGSAATGSTATGSTTSGAGATGASESGGAGGGTASGADRRPGVGGAVSGGGSDRRREEPGGAVGPEFA